MHQCKSDNTGTFSHIWKRNSHNKDVFGCCGINYNHGSPCDYCTVFLFISIGGKCNKKWLLNDSTDGETLPAHCTHWIKMWHVERSRLPTQEELLRCVKLKADVKSKLNKKRRRKTFKSLPTDDARLIRSAGGGLSYHYQRGVRTARQIKGWGLEMGKWVEGWGKCDKEEELSGTDRDIKSDQSVTAGEILLLLPWSPVLWSSCSIWAHR